MDTARISVFDLFGLPKPSETQEIKALVIDEAGDPLPIAKVIAAADEAQNAGPVADVGPSQSALMVNGHVSDARRYGRRAVMRRKFVKVRLPYRLQ
jgi:hypothetical protein